MADETIASAVANVTESVEEPTPSTDAIAQPAVAEASPAEDGVVATSGVAEGKPYFARSCMDKANALVAQFPRPTTHRKKLPRNKIALPAPRQRPERLAMTQVSQIRHHPLCLYLR
jgi:hypothetical protein